MTTYTYPAYTLGGYDFAANTISFDIPANPSPDVITLYQHYNSVTNYNDITHTFAPGDYFNNEYVNLLTGSEAKYALGITVENTGFGYAFLDMVPTQGGELEVVSQTFLYRNPPSNVPEPSSMALMPLALAAAWLVARFRARMER